MDAAGGLLFTGTGFAGNVHRHIGAGELADQLAHLFDLRRGAEQAGQIAAAAASIGGRFAAAHGARFGRLDSLFNSGGHFALDFALFQAACVCGCGFGLGRAFVLDFDRRLHQRTQLGEGDGLLQVVESTDFQRLHRLVGIAESGDDGHRHVQAFFVDVFDHFEAGAVGHTHIGEYQRVFALVEFFARGIHALGGLDGEPHLHQGHFHQIADIGFVVHHQYGAVQAVFAHIFTLGRINSKDLARGR